MSDSRLLDVANTILTNLATALTTAGIDVPTKQIVTTGDLAHDFQAAKCAEQFSITWDGAFQGQVSQSGSLVNQAIRCSMPLVAQFSLALLRCVPVVKNRGTAPSDAELNASGEQLLIDAMTLPAVLIDTHVAGTLLDDACTLLGIVSLQSFGPQGGVGGVVLSIQVSLV